jgi:hypothetical protein
MYRDDGAEVKLADTAFRQAEKRYKLYRCVCARARLLSHTLRGTLGRERVWAPERVVSACTWMPLAGTSHG